MFGKKTLFQGSKVPCTSRAARSIAYSLWRNCEDWIQSGAPTEIDKFSHKTRCVASYSNMAVASHALMITIEMSEQHGKSVDHSLIEHCIKIADHATGAVNDLADKMEKIVDSKQFSDQDAAVIKIICTRMEVAAEKLHEASAHFPTF